MTQRHPISRRSVLKAAALGTAGAGVASLLGAPTFAVRRASAQDTLRVIMIADPWVNVVQELGQRYQQEKGVEIAVESYPYDQTHQKEVLLGTQQSGDTDIIVLDAPWVGEFAEAGIVEDLKGRVDEASELQYDDFLESFRNVVTWSDQIVGIPFAPYIMMLHYRRDLFEQEGLQPPKTYTEVREAAKRFTNNPAYPGVYGIGLNNAKGAPVGQSWFEHIWNFGGKPFESNFPGNPEPYEDMTPRINSPQGLEVVNFFKEMLQYEPEGALNMAWDERAQAFASGKLAMATIWSARTPLMLDPSRSQVADKFSTAVFPAKEGVTVVPPLGGWLMGINSYSENKDAAWEFIRWFTSPEIHREFVLKGGPAARTSLLTDPEMQQKFPWFATLAESAPTAYADCRPRIPESFEIIDTIGNYKSQALSGQLSPEDALARSEEDIRTLLQGAGYDLS